MSVFLLCTLYCTYVTWKAFEVYGSRVRMNRPVVFRCSPLSSDVITPALVQEGTSQSGVSFPPPTYPIIASPACPLSHSRSLSPSPLTVSRSRRHFAQSSFNESSRSEPFPLTYGCGGKSVSRCTNRSKNTVLSSTAASQPDHKCAKN